MFQVRTQPTGGINLFRTAEVIFHATARNVRQSHRNAVVVLLLNIVQTAVMIVAFALLFQFLGLRGSALRGDFLLFLMSGIFLFMTHTKTVGAVAGSEGPASPMMHHAPMNSIVAICAASLGALYIQFISLVAVLTIYHIAFTPVVIDKPVGALGMFLLAWFSGVAVGTCLRALAPWFPELVTILTSVYRRANMLASGKMFVVNSMPAATIALFDWNPLFHAIDQTRGFTFLHYNPHFTTISYPVYLSLVLLLIGMMGEFYTRHSASMSWSAGR